ncbi:MAG: kinase-like domain-containing protein [Benniella sp.]|nr:MAG: kinase-like domain-containing protein [Benniella sp.]
MGSSVQSDQNNDTDGDTPLETDPQGRFQRLNEVLGKGAYKLVYRAIDQEEGVEVAWNQLRIDHLTKKEAQKILSEIEILQSIRNDHIINFYASWSTKAPNGGERIVFVTELMSSGTLKQYLKKTLLGSLKPKVLKSWCRQILLGLVYLHTHDPPIIHRDLKCDNIFINGNNGQLKIGDLGLAVVRHRTHVSSVLGTPEFMAPELYDEKYDEKVDIYAFGMCVLEMVTKEYPYSECTNQAQIYRKVTQGIKPQSLDHVQDPEIREFINRCLDHDDRTRPSAQELLDSDFLKPCFAAPSMCSSSAGLFNYSNRSVSDGLEIIENSHSATLTTAPSTSSASMLPSVVQPGVTSPTNKAPLQPISIPGATFTTTTTVDAGDKTYHIRSNLLPQTPTSAGQVSPAPVQKHEEPKLVAETAQPPPRSETSADPPTLHSHANTKTCSIQVVQYGEENGDSLNLKMICTCPVAGPRDVTMAAGTHEIKFPFDLHADTVEDVVAEMIREQILSGDDRDEATARIQELIDSVIAARKERAKIARERSRVEKSDHQGRSPLASHGHKNGNHHKLKVPLYDTEHYGTSPTESYDHYSSVGSNASLGWTGTESPVDSDQGYGTVPPHPPQQPPVITEKTFPPLSSSAMRGRTGNPADVLTGDHDKHHASYSEVVQHPATVMAQQPLSPKMIANRDRSPATRPPNAYGADQKPSPSGIGLALTNGALTKHTLREMEAANGDRKKPGDAEDVGYTSPYRHGVSSSSIGNHRRTPSVDAFAHIASSSPALSSAPIHTSPSEISIGAPSKMPAALSQTRPSISSTTSNALSPEFRPTGFRDSPIPGIAALTSHGLAPQLLPIHSASSDSGLLSYTSPLSEQELLRLKASSPSIPHHWIPQEQRVPHSGGASSYDPFHPLQDAVVPQRFIPHTLSQPLMTSEARKNIEQWTSKVQNPERITSTTGYMNGSNYSSCPEMSDDDDDLLDDELKILKERQRQELERMRLQHVHQLEMMMKLKEQKGLLERSRRKSDANTMPYPSVPSVPSPLPR